MAPQGRKIAIAGGAGTVGSVTLPALLSKNIHTITAISRGDSTATFPDACIVKKGSYDDEDFLLSALQDQDILLMQLGRLAMDTQDVLIRAAVKTSVKYILPTEFGSDIEALQMVKEQPPLWGKAERRKLVEELGGSWIAVVNNPWFDWSMGQGLWGIDIKARKATLYSGGSTKANTSTLQRVGEAVAELLSLPEEQLAAYKNKAFYVSSFYITQREMLESVQRVTDTTDKDWIIEDKEIAEVAKESDEELKKGNMMAMIPKFYSAHFREGYGGDFNHKVDLDRFGLVKEDIDTVIQGIIASGYS
ncbi:hypothetical protein BGZ61DRAFT_449150 [Ilyonectria robusta]|uniref:uncharacterized protein n=1 Tax=Ilyonectria robusta TaxID=1079257 RepID=UPI001E8E02CD|nr:uncharacterized protein BGZ61DRAFT_449150 [Ilyonectria robusta]KAH8714508.1 hypothetical protein BGZ61DRAFT_449150 [Ilyonectria robusta]